MFARARIRLCFGALLAALLGFAPGLHAGLPIGVTSAVNPAASGAVPGGGLRRLIIGENVVYNEHVVTGPTGQTQILFVDQSSLSLGPNADMVIDRFVYNPHTQAGELAASLAHGVFRFIGGELSKHGNKVTMTTPAATIGIRGGVFLADLKPIGQLDVIFAYGEGLTVARPGCPVQSVVRPDFEVRDAGPRACPSSPFPAPPVQIAQLLGTLDGRVGATGGATTIPTDETVEKSGISKNISADLSAASKGAGPSGSAASLNISELQDLAYLGTVSTQGAVVESAVAAAPPPPTPTATPTPTPTPTPTRAPPPAPTPTPPPAPTPNPTPTPTPTPPPPTPTPSPPPTPTPPPPTQTSFSGGFNSTGEAGTAFGYPQPGTGYSVGMLSAGVFSAALGEAGSVVFPLVSGTASFGPAGTQSPLGPVTGTSYLSPDGTFFYADLTPVNFPDQREFVYGGQAVNEGFFTPTRSPRFYAFTIEPDNALGSAIPFIRQGTGGSVSGAVVSPLYLAMPVGAPMPGSPSAAAAGSTLQASLAIAGAGASQSSVIVVLVGNPLSTSSGTSLAGQIVGSSLAGGTSLPVAISSEVRTPADGSGVSLYGGNALSGFVLAGTAGERSAGTGTVTQYGFEQSAVAASLPAGVGSSQTSWTLTGYFGGLMTRTGSAPLTYALTGTSTITTDAQNLRVAALFSGSDPFPSQNGARTSVTLNFGGLTAGADGSQAYIDDDRFAALQNPALPPQVNGIGSNGSIYMVTSGAVPNTALLPSGVSLCACEYLKWGYWGGTLDTPSSPNGLISPRLDVGHINTWVAGIPTPASDILTLRQTGFQGTYNGALLGSVFNNGAQYLAAGGLQETYNFGTQTGSFSVLNYDGRSFTAAIPKGAQSGAAYNFNFTAGGLTGPEVSGRVNGSFFGPSAAETGGNFAFTVGPSYLTSGIFAGKR